MSVSLAAPIKPTHKPIREYRKQLAIYAAQGVGHESALRTAFQNLLAETARPRHWTLIPELSLKIPGGTIRPDGTLRDDEWKLHRGYWEAKDTDDDLNVEIRKKADRGYPLFNTIFEDTRSAVLYQNESVSYRADLSQPDELADLLNQFYSHTKRDYEGFERAATEFKERVPQLAKGLLEKIREAHGENEAFKAAFDSLFGLCRASLNPNISEAAVDEMLVQHLMTERIFDKVFRDQDFVRRNVIAVEIEKVIGALISRSFNRHEFLRSLEPLYKVIERAAYSIEDFGEKQHFLNTVYERFFQGYSVKLADTHGIRYTPQQISAFMCSIVEDVLKMEFGLDLGSPGVYFLDPCTGTGNFPVNLIRRIPSRDLTRVYREQLFANEVMLLPYYIASQNIEHEYNDRTGRYEPFEGMCFVDTLEEAEAAYPELSFMTKENAARVVRQKRARINVVIGNPPYNVGQLNENDNNKNRKYDIIDKRVAATFAADSAATNKNALSDPYVKFFRWAIDRLRGGDGIVCFVSNNSFVDRITFDGMRKHLLKEFTRIYHLDLHGNVRKNPKLSGTTHNVFGIQVGVGITLAVRSSKHADRHVFYHRVPETWRKEEKLAWLAERDHLGEVQWTELIPDARHNWLRTENAEEYAEMLPIGSKAGKSGLSDETVFSLYGRGVATCRDDVAYDFDRNSLVLRMKQFIEDYNSEVDRYRRSDGDVVIDDFVRYERIKWSRDLKLDLQRGNYARYDESKIRSTLYRPFCKKYLFFDRILNEEVYVFPKFFPVPSTERENRAIWIKVGPNWPMFALATDRIVDLLPQSGSQCFPFYSYDEDGTDRRENITGRALSRFREHYGDDAISKWDVFHYVYGVLHQPEYREKFADNLKRELPRIPLLTDFWAFAEAGKRLAELHIGYERVEPWPLDWVCAKGSPLSYRVEKMRLGRDKMSLVVNETLTLAGIPPEVFRYRLGNRSALEWVIDQYQVTEDKRSGIKSDPNRKDDPEYIVRLVGQVVRVSVETVRIVESLPPLDPSISQAQANAATGSSASARGS